MTRRAAQLPWLVLGTGKVGSALASALAHAEQRVEQRSLRREGLPRRVDAKLVLLCARDPDLPELARALADRISTTSAVVHVAGALGRETLEPLAGRCAGVGQAHPLLSFASKRHPPAFAGAHLLVSGDRVAMTRARALARVLGMAARSWPALDLDAYHAAVGLAANGAAALAGAATTLLIAAGADADAREIGKVLGPLLRSVADNVERSGLPAALSGPIRRGDSRTVMRHLAAIDARAPELEALYLACARAQLPLARALGDATPARLSAVSRELDARATRRRNRARSSRKIG